MKKLKTISKSFFTLLLVMLTVFFVSCGQKNKAGGNEEGVIEFDTKGCDDKHPLYGLAPSSATLKFKRSEEHTSDSSHRH